MFTVKLIYRKLLKYKASTIINMLGLTVGFGLAVALLLYVQQEFSYDDFHSKKDRIVRVITKKSKSVFTSPQMGEWIKKEFPEVEQFVRSRHNETCVLTHNNNDHLVKWNMLLESSLFETFDFELITGDKKTCLNDAFSVVLTEHVAKEIFGDKNPIGKQITFNHIWNHTVTGVMADVEENSTFKIDVVFPFHAIEYHWKSSKDDPYNLLEEKYNQSFHTYLLFHEGVDIALAEQKICEAAGKEFESEFEFQSLKDIYFDVNQGERWLNKGNKAIVIILLSIAIGLLLIAVFNYINLNSSVSIHYLPSLCVRKINGSNVIGLIMQYVLENSIFIIVSFLLGIGICFAITPFINELMHASIAAIQLFTPTNMAAIALALIVIVFVTSLYPIWMVNSKTNIAKLKQQKAGGAIFNVRNVLVSLQFVLTIIFIVAALIIGKQLNFIKDKDLGFDSENLLYITINTEKALNEKILKEELLKNPNIRNVSLSAGLFGDIRRGNFIRKNGNNVHFNQIYTDAEYIPTMDYEIVDGRNFSNKIQSDFSKNALIINQTMARACELKNPLEEEIYGRPIVGVIKDFYINPLHKKVTPIALVCYPERAKWVINVKLNNDNILETIEYIDEVWDKASPDFPLIYTLADTRILSYYQKEHQFSKLAIIFSIVTIILSCVGIIGLMMFTIQNKSKEIGVRKVNGAKVRDVISTVNGDFIKWIIISYVIACPVAYKVMNLWLQNFAYRTAFGWWVFALAGITAFIIAIGTISWQSWKAANRNPVEALRYE